MPDSLTVFRSNPKAKLLTAAGVIVTASLLGFIYLHDQPNMQLTQPVSISSTGQKQFAIHLNHGVIDQGPHSITVKRGENLHLEITSSNQPEGDVRIDGYSQHTSIEANNIAGIEFRADKAGRFNIEVRQEEAQPNTPESDASAEAAAIYHHLGTFIVE